MSILDGLRPPQTYPVEELPFLFLANESTGSLTLGVTGCEIAPITRDHLLNNVDLSEEWINHFHLVLMDYRVQHGDVWRSLVYTKEDLENLQENEAVLSSYNEIRKAAERLGLEVSEVCYIDARGYLGVGLTRDPRPKSLILTEIRNRVSQIWHCLPESVEISVVEYEDGTEEEYDVSCSNLENYFIHGRGVDWIVLDDEGHEIYDEIFGEMDDEEDAEEGLTFPSIEDAAREARYRNKRAGI